MNVHRNPSLILALAIAAGVALSATSAALAVPPPNDNCSTPQVITGNGVFNFDLTMATTSVEGQDATCAPSQGFANDVWFCWTATCNGLVQISTCGQTAVDTKIAYYIGCACPTPPPSQPPLCCDDDGCGFQSVINCEAFCGQQFLIRIAAKPGTAPGAGTFTINCNGDPCDGCDNCCGQRPNFAGQAGFGGSAAVLTQESGIGGRVLDVINTASQPGTGSMVNWFAPFFNPTGPQNWTQSWLGTVFGVTLDDVGNIYVAHTSAYGFGSGVFDAIGTIPGGAPGAIYKIDTNTGIPSVFAVLPNNMITSCTGSECWPGLGNIAYNCQYHCFYVSNHEDGRIYRLGAGGTILSTWKHSTGLAAAYGGPDPFDGNGFSPLAPHPGSGRGQRVWAVRPNQGRLYYSVWREDTGRPSPTVSNEIWSVGLLVGGDFQMGTEQLEITLPAWAPGGGVYSNPVADISFKPDSCCMLMAERSMIDDTSSYAHQSRLLEACRNAQGNWQGSGNPFSMGDPGSGLNDSSAGGCDYDFHTGAGINVNVWGTADAIKLGSPPTGTDPVIYGLGGMTFSGTNPYTNGLMVDADQNTTAQDKFQQGDVEMVCPAPPPPACQADTNGLQCVNTCSIPGRVCVPVEVTRGPDGIYRVTRCDCVADGVCHLNYNGPDQEPSCVDGCPSGIGLCRRIVATKINNLVVYRCECTDTLQVCQPISVCNPNQPGTCEPACQGDCPTGEPCKPVEIREFPPGSGQFTISECSCDPSITCRPYVFKGIVRCTGGCGDPNGGLCKIKATQESPAQGGGIRYRCECDCRHPPQNMVDWWPMAQLTPVNDRANFLNHGTPIGGVAVVGPPAACAGPGALQFNGVNGYVSVPNVPGGADINFGGGNFTLEGWMRTSNPAFYQPMVDKRSGTVPNVSGYALFIWGGNLGFQFGGGGTFANFFTSGFNIADGQCHHVAATVTRGSPNVIRLYVDGVMQSFTNNTVLGSVNNLVPLLFGREYVFLGGPPVHLEGILDEFEFFRRALTQQEIVDLYTAKTIGKCCDTCYVPPVVFCVNENSKQLCFQICNYCDAPATYQWNLSGPINGSGCSATGPITFTPASGTTGIIKPGGCATVCVTVQLPTGMPVPPPIVTACYQLSTTNLATGKQFRCTNTITRSREWCFQCTPPCAVARMVEGSTRDFTMSVTNESNASGQIDYRWRVYYPEGPVADDQAVSLNGLPPGEPVIRTLALPLGQTAPLPPVAVTVLENEPFQPVEVVLEADTDGDGVPDPVERIVIRTSVCGGLDEAGGDLNQDGVTTNADIVRFVNALRGLPNEPYDVVLSDLNCDGHADGADVQGFVDELLNGP